MQVVVRKTAKRQLELIIAQGEVMFGQSVAAKLYNRFIEYAERLSINSALGFPEPLLAERHREYRSLMLNERFKLVYYHDKSKDIIYIIDLWDTRREPISLSKRIRGK